MSEQAVTVTIKGLTPAMSDELVFIEQTYGHDYGFTIVSYRKTTATINAGELDALTTAVGAQWDIAADNAQYDPSREHAAKLRTMNALKARMRELGGTDTGTMGAWGRVDQHG